MSAGTNKVGSAFGAVLGVGSPVIAVVVFLLVFNSYRQEKKMLVKQVVKNLQALDICAVANSAAAVDHTINPVMLASLHNLPTSAQLLLDEGPVSGILPGHAASMGVAPGDPTVHNPDDPSVAAETTKRVQRVGKEITLRCLQRWDGLLGFRASKDSLERQSGIWREQFDGVRFASMLLAFRKLNASLGYNQLGNTGQHWAHYHYIKMQAAPVVYEF